MFSFFLYVFPQKGTLTDAGDGGEKKTQKVIPKQFVSIFFPQKGTLTDTGDGDGGGQKTQKTHSETICSIFVSPRRELWLTPVMGMGGHSKKKHELKKQYIVEYILYYIIYFVYLYI